MKVELEQINSYTITIDGVAFPECKLISEWEGMAKYHSTNRVKGEIILSMSRSFEADIFAQVLGKTDQPIKLIKASETVLMEIKTKRQKEEK